MSRVQLALNVSDLDEAIAFYSKLFGAEPAKLRPGYANFAIADPPLKLVLMEDAGAVVTASPARSTTLASRSRRPTRWLRPQDVSSDEGLETEVEEQTNCCFAIQDKVWVNDPDGAPWEVYTVLADAPAESGIAGDGTCCIPEAIQGVPVAVGGGRPESSSCC